MKHPFAPLLTSKTKQILVGTLPPETATFYFSNSSNTRLWDILNSIAKKKNVISSGSNKLTINEKTNILSTLDLGIYDIILEYDRVVKNSTKDEHINPKKYNDLLSLANKNRITKILFVYKNAAKWFLHSLEENHPKKCVELNYQIEYGVFKTIKSKHGEIKCILLPSPLNRGKKGETLEFKLEQYRKEIIS